jgi:Protein of unknown function, DUF547
MNLLLKHLLLAPVLLVTLASAAQSSSPAVRYSEVLLFALRDKQPVEGVLNELWQYKEEDLWSELREDKYKKAFWINMYNAFVLLSLSKQTGGNTIPRRFFKQKIVRVAGREYTLDAIEKKMLGTGGKGLQQWDYRLLFSLNKGTVSSPDIIIYDSENVDRFLQIATKAYLKREVWMDEDGFEAKVPMVFKKRRNDFGGKEKVLEILRFNEVIYMNVVPKLEYKAYNHALKPGSFLPAEMLRQ